MEDIITKDGFFKYRWRNDIFGEKGCGVCDLKDDSYCPKDICQKNGCYMILTFDEMKSEYRRQVAEEWKKHKK